MAPGVVRWFGLESGNRGIAPGGAKAKVFFNFTAIPGEGYRTVAPGMPVLFELVEGLGGSTASNVQRQAEE